MTEVGKISSIIVIFNSVSFKTSAMNKISAFATAALILSATALASCGGNSKSSEEENDSESLELATDEVEPASFDEDFLSDLNSDDDDALSSKKIDVPRFDDDDDIVSTTSRYTSDESSESVKESKSSNDWDSILDAYEKFSKKYIEFAKKVKDKKIDIMSPEYQQMTREAAEYLQKLQDANPSTMTASQWARYSKLAQKTAEAAQYLR